MTVTGIFFLLHVQPFSFERQPGRHEIDLLAFAGDLLMQKACMVAKLPGHPVLRHDAHSDIVGNEHQQAGQVADAGAEHFATFRDVFVGHHQIVDPQGEAIDDDRLICPGFAGQGFGQMNWFFDGFPTNAASLSVMGNAGPHFIVQSPAGRHVNGR